MCGRFEDVLTDKAREALTRVLGPLPWLTRARSEVRPTDAVQLVRDGERGLELATARWGLVPTGMGAAELKKYALFNARIETLETSRAFEAAFRSRRCVLPISAFYEWPGEGKTKQKTRIARRDGLPLLVAGLWNRCEGPEGLVESCTLVTRPPTADLRHMHDRMPALLLSGELDAWLHGTPAQAQRAALGSWRPGVLQAQAV
jgi:putative SOS response-associated peptidase YedK